MSHRCPVDGCRVYVGAELLMCRRHWKLVPKKLRDRVWQAWRAISSGGRDAYERHSTACVEATNAVNELVATKENA